MDLAVNFQFSESHYKENPNLCLLRPNPITWIFKHELRDLLQVILLTLTYFTIDIVLVSSRK